MFCYFRCTYPVVKNLNKLTAETDNLEWDWQAQYQIGVSSAAICAFLFC